MIATATARSVTLFVISATETVLCLALSLQLQTVRYFCVFEINGNDTDMTRCFLHPPLPPACQLSRGVASSRPHQPALRSSFPVSHATQQQRRQQQEGAQQHLPCLVLPGFLGASTASQYAELRAALEKRHHCTDVLLVQTADWLPTLAGGSFAWYLERLADAVRRLQTAHGGSKVCLVSSSSIGIVRPSCVWCVMCVFVCVIVSVRVKA